MSTLSGIQPRANACVPGVTTRFKLSSKNLTATPQIPHHVMNAIQRRPVDVVITDIKLPFMSGLELLSEIKSVKPDIPVIVITAYGSENIASEAMKRGAYEFIEKPFELDEMTDLLERLKEERQIHHNY